MEDLKTEQRTVAPLEERDESVVQFFLSREECKVPSRVACVFLGW